MRTFMSGLVFIGVLAAALSWVAAFSGIAIPDLGIPHPLEQNGAPALAARFEPTSPAIVSEMLKMAAVTSNDVVFDLGSGDGRIVIAAARSAGARGIGVDLDGELIRQSRTAAERENVSGLVQFLQEDLFQTDFSKATVVMLYLSPEANLRLRPRLLRELKPGTRIVSHSHSMGDWKPDNEARVENHMLYSWLVPAHVAGSWSLEITDKYMDSGTSLRFKQAFQNIEAGLRSGNREIAVAGAGLQGGSIQFTVEQELGSLAAGARFTGEVDGDRMTGKFRSASHSGTWTAKRTR